MTVAVDERRPDTRERIAAATLQLINERGISAVTMKSIAAAAGVARQTLYNHFPDVDTIIAESIGAHQVASLTALRTVLATIESPVEQLEHLVRHSAAVAVFHGPALSTRPFTIQPSTIRHGLSAEVQAILRQNDEELVAIIRDTLQAGTAGDVFRADLDLGRDPAVIKRMLEATAELAANDPDSIKETVAAAARTVLAAVAAGAS